MLLANKYSKIIFFLIIYWTVYNVNVNININNFFLVLNSKTNLASKTLLSIFEHSILPVKENMDTSDIMNQNHTTKGQRFNTLNSYKKRQRKEPQFQRSDKHQTIRTKKQIEAVEVPAPDYDSTSISSANSVKFKRNGTILVWSKFDYDSA